MAIQTMDPIADADQGRAALLDLLVPAAMLSVSVASGVACYLHLGLTPEFAAAIGLTLFSLMLVGHVLVRAGEPAEWQGEAEKDMVESPFAPIVPELPVATPGGALAKAVVVPSAAPETAPASTQSEPQTDRTTDRAGAEAGREPALRGAARGPGLRRALSPAELEQEVTASVEAAARAAELAAGRPHQQGEAVVVAPSRVGEVRGARGSGGAAKGSPPPPPLPLPSSEAQLRSAVGGAGSAAVRDDATAPAARPSQVIAGAEEADGADAEAASRPSFVARMRANARAWSYRPLDLKLPEVEQASKDGADQLGAVRPRPDRGRQVTGDRSAANAAEAQRIDNILQRLAEQIRSGRAAQDGQAIAPEDNSVERSGAEPSEQSAVAEGGPGATAGDGALANAVDALRATVETMRQATATAAPAAATGSSTAPPAPPSPPSSSSPSSSSASAVAAARGRADAALRPDPAMVRLAAVAEALASERADVFLEPILGLRDEQARHFEVFVHLASPSGELLDARVLTEGARGAGLLPVLDALGIRHSAGFALKLERRGRDGSVFSQIAGESLESSTFVADVAARHAQGISDRLVLTFAQSEIRGLGPAQFKALADLRDLGFRFAVQNVADLDMDFEALRDTGFEFVKLDASVFLDGLQLAGSHVPARDLCRHFADLDFAVIVGKIDSEPLRERVVSCGAVLGQGMLFGAPRRIPTGASDAGGVAA